MTSALPDDLTMHHLAAGGELPDAALELLDRGEREAGVPLVDEAEQLRLQRWSAGEAATMEDVAPGWGAVLLCVGGDAVAYAATVTEDTRAVGDVAVTGRQRPDRPGLITATLACAAQVAMMQGASRVQLWLRAADQPAIQAAETAGFAVDRRLAVLGRTTNRPATDGQGDAGAVSGVAAGGGVRVRAYQPDADDQQVADVLAAAYEGTDEAGWDLASFQERRTFPWFRPDDLLVAEDDGDRPGATDGLLGLHWIKRRDATTGEVYNLAVRPDAQGRGVGPALLAAGLDHLAAAGFDDVILWVDRANQRAVRLYERAGFSTRWEDVALGRDLVDARHDHG